MTLPSFPGGTSVTLLDVYDDAGPDGLRGGTPHLHLASTEAYVVVSGSGALHTINAGGLQEIALQEGSIVWFTPGTIHRAVNHENLRVLVIMSNSGLPEAGDAVMTFPHEVVRDPERYRQAATLPEGATDERAVGASRRRDLAVEGYLEIARAVRRGDPGPLEAFYEAAAGIVREKAVAWTGIVRRGPLALAHDSISLIDAVSDGRSSQLSGGALRSAPRSQTEAGFGMCGRLRVYEVDGLVARADDGGAT